MPEPWSLAVFLDEMGPDLLKAVLETLYMVGLSTLFAVVLGVPLGVLLTVTDRGHVLESPGLARLLGSVVNTVRSVPFIILVVALIPLTRLIVGTTIGPTAAVVSLTVAATPFLARLVDGNLREVDPGVIQAALVMGASPWQIVRKVLLPEALPGLVHSATVLVVNLVAYSAITGAVGAGGLGQLAINYGYYRYRGDVMIATVILLVVIVQALQALGDRTVRALDRR
ncbi:methionine ABC transporter permease [Caldinitratiruptor microaerophilus]|uniref:Methionine ABC transporter permease n=1 Tax=Caldinitratiruptor microaerophilus TaxID=671077 RepID=A0AA35CHE2_9FIRM|nr:methionine ABC transporter permease [Caldinitratiruptor microaerophilus]BDG58995.1 methionine ABC transporter permease [Caldinitratiruptor microaerophilus]